MTRVLVTGPTGFLGRHCLERLRREPCEIHAVNRSGGGAARDDTVRWHAADLREPGEARRLVAAVRPDRLLHLAWEATPRVYGASPENLRWLEAGAALLAAFGEAGGARFLGAGSSAEYDPGPAACIEDETPIRPATVYGKCKAACWLAAQAAAQRYGFAAAWGRIFLPYGPGDPPARLVPTVVAALDRGQPVETTHGRQQRDFIYAPDAADLLVRLLLSDDGGAFNIGTGRPATVRSVIEFLADRRGRRDLLRLGAIAPAPGEPPVLVADMAKVQRCLAWSAPTPVESGLAQVLDAGAQGAAPAG
jgi:nucleoside-diphosphate-sugar epimerase